jgi:hypothetical protein
LRATSLPEEHQAETFTAACSAISRPVRAGDRYEFRVEHRVALDTEVRVCHWVFHVSDFSPMHISVVRAPEKARSGAEPLTRTAAAFAVSLASTIDRRRAAA